MARFGIVMTFVNVLVAAGVLVLAAKDYGRYRTHAYSAFRHDLLITGLPIDEDEVTASFPDDATASKLTNEVIKSVFEKSSGGTDLGGAPVKTVNAEIERVLTKIDQNIRDLSSDEKKQREKLWNYLQFHARTFAERQEYEKKCKNGPIDQALAELKLRATYIRDPQGRSDKPNNKEIRLAAAMVLINLSADPDWRDRVVTVVGLEAYVTAMGLQADAFAQIVGDFKSLITRENGNFEAEYESSMRELMYKSEELFQAKKRLSQLVALQAERQAEVNRRTTEVMQHEQDLLAKTADANSANARLEEMQRQLFAIQQRRVLALQETEKLEEYLRSKVRMTP